MDDDYWTAVRTLRLRVAGLLESLGPAEWEAESLCRGWRIRDVAGHLSLIPTITTWDLLAAAPRARFNPNTINTLLAVRHGAAPPPDIVARIREHAGARRTAFGLSTRDWLFDVIVHSQDIALPLSRRFEIAPEVTREGLRRVWDMGWPFNARRRLAGLKLRATDTAWTVGAGPEVSAPALSLLLVLTGRIQAAAATLSGPGVRILTG